MNILKAILSLPENFVTDHYDFVFFQFIFAIITGFFGLCLSCCMMLIKKIVAKSEAIMKAQKEQEEQEKLLKETEKEVAEKRALIELFEKYKKDHENFDEGLNINED